MKIGIIGTGKHGSRYARHIIADFPDHTLAAVSRRSVDGRGQAGEWKCKYHCDWRNLINDPDVEAVISVVPPSLNFDIAKACVAAGKPLLIEKPLAVDSVIGNSIVVMFDKADLPLTVAQTLRYNGVVQGLKANIDKTGTLHSFSASQRLEPSTLKWLEDPFLAGAGVILHVGRGESLKEGDPMYEIVATTSQRLTAAKRLAKRLMPITLERMVLEHISDVDYHME